MVKRNRDGTLKVTAQLPDLKKPDTPERRALDAFVDEHNRPPTGEEYDELMSSLATDSDDA